MDPKACFEALLNAQINNDAYEINQYKADLIGWLNGGGFGPTVELIYRDTNKVVTLVELKWTGEAVVKFGNGRKRVTHIRQLAAAE